AFAHALQSNHSRPALPAPPAPTQPLFPSLSHHHHHHHHPSSSTINNSTARSQLHLPNLHSPPFSSRIHQHRRSLSRPTFPTFTLPPQPSHFLFFIFLFFFFF